MRTKRSIFLSIILVVSLVIPFTACSPKKKADPNILDLNNKPKSNEEWISELYICEGVLYNGMVSTLHAVLTDKMKEKVNSENADEYKLTMYLFKSFAESTIQKSDAIVSLTRSPEFLCEEDGVEYMEFFFDVDLRNKNCEGSYTFVVAREDGTVESKLETKVEPMPETTETQLVGLKPVIYLYPETQMDVSVKMDIKGEILCTYPEYGEGWNVTAYPGGKLFDKSSERYYDYLFWEASSPFITDRFEKAACVAVEDTAAFLEEYLAAFGLNDSEIDDFISFWLPRMQGSAYNLISFPNEEYKSWAEISVVPAPETEIRIFMVYKPLDEAIEISEDRALTLPETPVRKGFTVVEWGGSMVEK